MMGLLTSARIVAVAVSVPTFGVLFLNDGFRADNLFLVPDLVLCALLLVGAVLPTRTAQPVLTFGFGFAAGVITTAVFSYVARGALDEGLPTVVVACACVVMATLLARRSRLPAWRGAAS
ncbi:MULTISPECIES: hypothetical protein [Prauserella]|uniref:Uncharacterized protein n=1 Tax=Prauserella endophytica TaxID=1592324 RepID=A0ABY2S9N9_9PSEU|nr:MULTISPECIES: hypothetical protein [Prauserella]TKG71730.1 hypothetical protein FCN18_09485 [Prauserella endophytica]